MKKKKRKVKKDRCKVIDAYGPACSAGHGKISIAVTFGRELTDPIGKWFTSCRYNPIR
jgi:hypothetical protein